MAIVLSISILHHMKRVLLIFCLCNLVGKIYSQNICACTAKTSKENQHRTKAKHETHYENYVMKKNIIDVKYVYAWEKKYASATNTIKTDAGNVASLRKAGTPEDTLYTLRGYIWFVKLEGNDCDLHMEIGTKDRAGTRIIVEVTKENKQLQEKIKQHLDSIQLLVYGCGTSNLEEAHFNKGIQVLIAGLGFYDASHKPNTNHGDSHTKKYSWELHPVRDIVFL